VYEIGRFAIYGEHEIEPTGKVGIRLMPHSHHAAYPWWSLSTQSVLARLERLDLTGKSVLDFGCGASCILGLAAARLGGVVTAVEIHPELADIAQRQAEANPTLDVTVRADDPGGMFDVILANVGDAELLDGLVDRAREHFIGTARKRNLLQKRPGTAPTVVKGYEDIAERVNATLHPFDDFAVVEV